MIILPSLQTTTATQDAAMREVLDTFSRGEEIEEHHLQTLVDVIEDLDGRLESALDKVRTVEEEKQSLQDEIDLSGNSSDG